MRLLVTGARGLMGSALVDAARARGIDVRGPDREHLDVTCADQVRQAIGRASPDVIAHCAAYTDVDVAERESDVAMSVNRDGTRNVASAAAEAGSLLVYASTDFVFDGERRLPYGPADEPNPVNAYGRSKLAGEEEVRRIRDLRWIVLRTSWLYGSGGRNFVDTILRRAEGTDVIKVVSDQVGRPRWSHVLAPDLLDLVESGATGVVHMAGRGEATWLELARVALALQSSPCNVEGVSTEAWGAAAPRHPYSVLDTEECERLLGRSMPHWHESLETYLAGR